MELHPQPGKHGRRLRISVSFQTQISHSRRPKKQGSISAALFIDINSNGMSRGGFGRLIGLCDDDRAGILALF